MSTVDAFLTALQRNLFTKPVLPTEVEFSLLDTFDVVDSQWRQAAKSAIATTKKDEAVPRERDEIKLGEPRSSGRLSGGRTLF
jgi:hypothetical protein